jgi:cytochrome c553
MRLRAVLAQPHARPVIHHGALLLALMSGLSAHAAADVTALRTEALAASCAACHGTAGQAAPGAGLPALAGLPREVFIAQMTAFKTGQREATVMHQLAKGYSEAQIAQLAGYFAAQPR